MRHLKGTPLSPGIAIGPLFCIQTTEHSTFERTIAPKDAEEEIELFKAAILQVKTEVEQLRERFQKCNNHEGMAILEGYLHILDDPLIIDDVISQVRRDNKTAEYLFHKAICNCQLRLTTVGNSFFKERVRDLKDIEQRVLRVLKGVKQLPLPVPPDNAILFAKELSPTDIAEGEAAHIRGFVTQYGGATSHSAIVLQARKIPLISSIDYTIIETYNNATVIIDGNSGDIYIDPDATLVQK